MGDDPIRQHYAAAWICELSGSFNRPVVLEEFGVTSDFVSDTNAAHYYRQILHDTLLAGASGWIAWNNTDYDGLIDQDPYRHHPFELHFGLTDVAGRPKPQLVELKRFAELLEEVDYPRLSRTPAETALVVSSFLDTSYPFTDPLDGPYYHETLRQAYISTRLADLPVAIARESDGIGRDARLYLIPSTKQLLSTTWHQLTDLAAQGATVYVSYSPGAHSNQRGPWHANMNALFGVEHQLMYGLIDAVEEEFEFNFTAPFGSIAAGARLSFRGVATRHSRCMLPVKATDAEVLAVDGEGRPALLVRRVGAGSIVLCTYPIEHLAATTPGVNPDTTRDLYDALADFAGVERAVTVDDPRVAVDVLVHGDGTRYVWLVSQADEALTVKPSVRGTARLAEDDVVIPAYGVRVVRLEG
jgi:endo-1,4-beta-mannosidase